MSHELSEEAVLAFAFDLKSLVTELNATLSALFRPLGLTSVQAEALMELDRLGPVTLKELSGHLVAESGHPSRLISRMVDDGLVSRSASTTDGRAVVLQVTERGRRLAEQAREARAPLLAEFAGRYGDRIDVAAELIQEVRRSLTETAAQDS